MSDDSTYLPQRVEPASAPSPTDHWYPAPPPPSVVQPAAPVINVNVNAAAPAAAAAAPPPIIILGQQKQGPGFIVRALWFVCVGWWLSAFGILLGYFLMLTIFGIPLAFGVFNRVPQMLTLRPRSNQWSIETVDGITRISQTTIKQHPWWLRALYFGFFGFWFGAIWITLAWSLAIFILPLPLSLWMLDRISAVMTLQRH